jgi:hypothetical protein
MRLWTLHPRYLDRQGLLALWREALLAQKVLQGGTRGYRSHPQLLRFREAAEPLALMAAYLREVHAEALLRGYSFNAAKIGAAADPVPRLRETQGQLDYEWRHLLAKLSRRSPALYERHRTVGRPQAHPCFEIVPGPVAAWERTARPES